MSVPGPAEDDSTAAGSADHPPERRRLRVGLPSGATLRGWLRHSLWRGAFRAIGGFRVEGGAPVEAMVIAANHSSHMDSPAILAAFPSPYKPVSVAAGDYWFGSRLRSWAARTIVGAVPVDRTGGGGYATLVERAEQVLGHGQSLLLFPEGTRSTDGSLGSFRSGAMRLARDFEVPLLPVAIVGTGELLPKGGRFLPGPVEVRVGTPIGPDEWDERGMEVVRAQITKLLAKGPARPTTSRTWTRLNALMEHPAGLAGAFVWGFAEAIVWPVTNEMFLAIFAVAAPRRVPHTVLALTAGSVTGIVVNAALAKRGVRVPAPLTTGAMRTTALAHMSQGPAGIWQQALNGVPSKVYARAAGELGVPLGRLAAHSAGARGVRAAGVGVAVGVAARRTAPFLKRFLGPYEIGLAATFAVGLTVVYRSWKRR